MIETSNEKLLESDAQAYVNTVNTAGVMGKGIALLFKEKFDKNYREYRTACKNDKVKVGKMHVVDIFEEQQEMFPNPNKEIRRENPKWIINFPTKKHWRGKSDLKWIEDGVEDLVRVIDEKGIESVALPQRGCGNGGLDWKQVEPIIQKAFADSSVRVIVYESPKEPFL